ncbi:MAG: ribonuclease P protein component [Betaproteobacteria bacterium]|nr:ribonuclease P protein component [Betaproteobacteria bacterium]
MPAIHAFQRSKRLRKTDEISSVFSFKRQVYGQYLRLLAKPNNLGYPRFAGIISKKTAPLSVTRNYIKRCLREIFRRNQGLFGDVDIIVVANKKFSSETAQQVEQEFLRQIEEIKKKLVGV